LSQSSKIPLQSLNQINIAEVTDVNHNNKYNQIRSKINPITKGQKPYISRILNDIFNNSTDNAEKICDFIIAEQNEINIKESTMEWHIKVLGQLLRFHNFKNFKDITKKDILEYLNSLRKSSIEDPQIKALKTEIINKEFY
jgi:hypothetical protein